MGAGGEGEEGWRGGGGMLLQLGRASESGRGGCAALPLHSNKLSVYIRMKGVDPLRASLRPNASHELIRGGA